MKTNCLECKKEFNYYPSNSSGKYCSPKCYNKARYEKEGQRSTKEQRSEWYKKRKKQKGYIEKLRKQANERKLRIKQFLDSYKLERGCKDCGYKEHPEALEFDHIKNNKSFNVALSKSIRQAKDEIKKCEVVCANCHRIRSHNRRKNLSM